MSVKTNDPDISTSDPYVSGERYAAASDATPPNDYPIRHQPARPPTSGSDTSSSGSSSSVRNRECAVELAYSRIRSPALVNTTTTSATSMRWIRLSSTVFIDAYCRKSGPSWTISTGYEAVIRN